MNYIKLYESYNENDEDVDYILGDYYHEEKLDITNSDYFKLYKFHSLYDYSKAIEDLKRHGLKYYTMYLYEMYGVILNKIDNKILNFLDSKLLNLKFREDRNYIYYVNNKNETHTLNCYDKNNGIFYIDKYNIWAKFNDEFKIDDFHTSIITTCYIRKKILKDCAVAKKNGIEVEI